MAYKVANRFKKGSGCYTCKVCKRLTREVGDGAGVGLCDLCFDVAGWENTMMDSDPGSAEYQEAAEWVKKLNAEVVARGGKLAA